MNKKKYVLIGIFCILISAFGFALMQLFIRLADGVPSINKAFFRNLIASFLALIPLLKNKVDLSNMKGNWGLLILRSIFGTAGMVLNFYAVSKLTLSDASMLQKISPFIVIILSYIFLKEKIKPYQYVAVLIAFGGILFIIKPGVGGDIISIGALAGVLGAVAAGSAYTCLRGLSLRKVSGVFIIFFFSAFSCIVLLPMVIVNFKPMTMMQMMYVLMIGVSATLGQFGITYAYSFAPANKVSVFEYFQVIFAALMGYIFFSEIPDLYSWIGYVIVIGVGVYMIYRGAKNEDD